MFGQITKMSKTTCLGAVLVALVAASASVEAGAVSLRATTLGSLFTNSFAPASEQATFAARAADGANYSAGLRRRCLGAAVSTADLIPAEILSGGASCEYRNYFVFDLRDKPAVDLDPILSNVRLTLPTAFASADVEYQLRFVGSGQASDLADFTGFTEGLAVDASDQPYDASPLNPLIDSGKSAFEAIGNGQVIGTLDDAGDPFDDICLDGDGDLLYANCELFPPMKLVDIAFNAAGVQALENAFGGYLILGGTIADTDPGQLFGFGSTNDFVQLAGSDENFFQPSNDFLFGDNFLTLSFKVPLPSVAWLLALGAITLAYIKGRRT